MPPSYFTRKFSARRLEPLEMFAFFKAAGLAMVAAGFRDAIALEMCRRWSPVAKHTAVSSALVTAGLIQLHEGNRAATVDLPCNPLTKAMRIEPADCATLVAIFAHAFTGENRKLFDWTGGNNGNR